MATSKIFTPYSTAVDLFGAKPNWIPNELDVMRIQSYQLYEEIYWNVPDVLKVAVRGSNELPIYVPSGRTIIDTTHRYVAPQFGLAMVDAVSGQPTPASVRALAFIEAFMRRERFRSKFNGNKRYGLIRGDAIWHVTADPSKPEGSRISITAIDPGMYFPIYDEDNVEKILGVHLVETISTEDGPRIRRLTYRKVIDEASGEIVGITVEDGVFRVDKWEGPEHTPERVIQPEMFLPEEIKSIPVYHERMFEEPGNPFGSSELRGLERLMAGLNQTMSDEDLALALAGIGVYATDGGHPVDPKTREQVSWQLGPGRVVHTDGTFFNRVPGVSGLNDSYGAHYDRLWEALRQASSTPDVAIGSVDVSVAQSGIALALQLGPMLAKAGEKSQLILDTQNQMWFDLVRMWFPAYEDQDFESVTPTCVVGDAVPVDRVQRFAELNDMLDRGVIDTEYYRTEAAKLGYVFPEGMAERAKAEFDERNAQPVDPFAERVDEEIASGEDTEAPSA